MSRHSRTGQVNHTKPPPHLDFLLVLTEFSQRLLMVDRSGEKGVLPFLMKQLPEGQFRSIQEGRLSGWDPLLTYFAATKGGVAANVGAKGKKRAQRGMRLLYFYGVWFHCDVILGGEGVAMGRPPTKAPRLEATPTGSEGGSEEGGSESGSPPPPVASEGRRTRGRGQQRKGEV